MEDIAHVYIDKKQKKLRHVFIYTKSQTLFKKLDNFRYVFMYKMPYTWRYEILMKRLTLAFKYKKHEILRYVTFFIYKKLDTSQKARQFAIRLYTKIRHFCFKRFFIEFLKFAEEGGYLFIENSALCVTLLFTKSPTLSITF